MRKPGDRFDTGFRTPAGRLFITKIEDHEGPRNLRGLRGIVMPAGGTDSPGTFHWL
jgi:hypothetical protein